MLMYEGKQLIKEFHFITFGWWVSEPLCSIIVDVYIYKILRQWNIRSRMSLIIYLFYNSSEVKVYINHFNNVLCILLFLGAFVWQCLYMIKITSSTQKYLNHSTEDYFFYYSWIVFVEIISYEMERKSLSMFYMQPYKAMFIRYDVCLLVIHVPVKRLSLTYMLRWSVLVWWSRGSFHYLGK